MKILKILTTICIVSMFSCGDLARDNKFDPKADNCPGYPTADFTVNDGDAAALQQQPSVFSAAVSNDPGGTALQYRWYFASDGEWSAWSSAETVSRNYLVVSSEEVSLEVVNELGMLDSVKKTVQIVDSQPPVAAFTYSPSNPSVGNVVTFDASSSNDDDSLASEIQVRWDFENDSNIDTVWSVSKTATNIYQAEGTITAKLYVKDKYGVGSSTTQVITVLAIPTYTVTYDGNGSTGGTVPVSSTSYKQGDTVTVLGNIGSLVNIQYGISLTFQGWNTKANCSGTSYSPGQTFTMGSANVTLYAKWSSIIGATGPAGGLIFYDKGIISDGWRYLEAAPSLWNGGSEDPELEWSSITNTLIGTTDTGIGTGRTNTAAIISQGATAGAAYACVNYSGGGYSDWFLPSIDELNLIYTNLYLNGASGFADYNYYWSSSEYDAYDAWGENVTSGIQYSLGKLSTRYVRPIRAF